jgi:hypothetical protein
LFSFELSVYYAFKALNLAAVTTMYIAFPAIFPEQDAQKLRIRQYKVYVNLRERAPTLLSARGNSVSLVQKYAQRPQNWEKRA